FPGQGSQWVGMAAELLGASEVFAGRMAECGRALLGRPTAALLPEPGEFPAAHACRARPPRSRPCTRCVL
ncbi:acyltransferase domain-containing protein, partial [Streptomyces microflavus]|uniref:acyltransferase domain-containing protein n=1 Tax=Streptomyces microflavus TaxID=1919 RepID=UPI0034114B29